MDSRISTLSTFNGQQQTSRRPHRGANRKKARRRIAGIATTTLLTATSMAVGIAPAQAASYVAVYDGELTFTADPGTNDAVTVSMGLILGIPVFTLANTNDTVGAGPGCFSRGANTVDCPITGIRLVTVYAGSGDDSVDASGVNRPTAIYTQEGIDAVRGGTGKDTIVDREGFGFIDGGPGDDRIWTGGSRDWIRGEAGNDYIESGAGNDDIWGGEGDDTINGEAGDDFIAAEAGDDDVFGLTGSDRIRGDSGNDRIRAGGTDLLSASSGEGDGSNNWADGGEGSDYIFGGDGQDTFYGREGDDLLAGNKGGDVLFNNGAGNDITDGGPGGDQLQSIDGISGNDTMFGGFDNDLDNCYADAGDYVSRCP
jgi:Ca2+-binding RTX toxin-like protein